MVAIRPNLGEPHTKFEMLTTLNHPLRIVNAQNDRFKYRGRIIRSQKRMLLRVICENDLIVTVLTVMATSKFEKYGVAP